MHSGLRLALLAGTLATTGMAMAEDAASADAGQARHREQGPNSLPEVKVTAERRESTLQKTPVSVGVVDAQVLDDKAGAGLTTLAGEVAGLSFPNNQPSAQTVSIRGIGISRQIGFPSVGFYLDDVYLSRVFGIGLFGAFPDLERVEVLRGPQGTLYGQNSSAGALRLISLQPSEEASGWAEIGIGNNGAFNARTYLSGAIKPGVLVASVAYAHQQDDGDLYNVALDKDANTLRNDQIRVKFRLTPSETLDATLSLDYLRDRTQSRDSSPISYGSTVYGLGERQTIGTLQDHRGHDNGGMSLAINKKVGGDYTLRSITAARGFEADMPVDSIPVGGYVSGFNQALTQRQYSQEFQFLGNAGDWDFIAGLIAFKESFEVDRISWSAGNFSVIQSDSDSHNLGLYGQLGRRFGDSWHASAGVRYNRSKAELDSRSYASNLAREHLADIYSVSGETYKDNALTPKLAIDYQAAANVFTYLSVAKGETSGGFNPIAASAAVARIPVQSEKVTTYEFGAKSHWLDGRLRVNGSAFYSDYQDYQASIANPVVNGVPVVGGVFLNAGQAELYGVELESALRVSPSLELSANLSRLHSEFGSFVTGTGADDTSLIGKALPNAPRLLAGARISYLFPESAWGDFRLNLAARHESSAYSSIAANRELTRSPSTTYVDLTLKFVPLAGNWSGTLAVSNLLDRTYTFPVITGAYSGQYFSRSRQLLLSLRKDFF